MHTLSDEQRRYLKIETAINAFVNAVISALFAWLFFRNVPVVPLWGEMGMAVDLIPTVFMITLVPAIPMSLVTRRRVRSRIVAPIDRRDFPMLSLLPGNVVLRAILLALAATIVLVPLTVTILWVLGIFEMGFAPFVAFKIAYGVLVSLVTTPVVLLAALSDRTAPELVAAKP